MENSTQKETQEKTLKLEREIKVLILLCALKLIPRNILYLKLTTLIAKYNKDLPKNLIDREKYIQGAYKSSVEMIRTVYEPITYNFKATKEYETPMEYVSILSNRIQTPTDGYYPDILKNALRNLNRNELVYSENGKRPISLWQKTELDIRHDAQMKMVDKCYKSGIDLFWLSSHANCSKRCEKHQGKLVSLTLKSIDSSFWTGTYKDGIKVYSFTDIENQIDKYGYKNNIINGFNCRHQLISYKKGEKPFVYSDKEIAKTRSLENAQREMERAIRRKKTEMLTTDVIYHKRALKIKHQISDLMEEYKAFCKKNGLIIEKYRIF